MNTTACSFAVEVIANLSGEWRGSAMRFATRKEAEQYAQHLRSRWILVVDARLVESTEPVNYSFIDGRLKKVGS